GRRTDGAAAPSHHPQVRRRVVQRRGRRHPGSDGGRGEGPPARRHPVPAAPPGAELEEPGAMRPPDALPPPGPGLPGGPGGPACHGGRSLALAGPWIARRAGATVEAALPGDPDVAAALRPLLLTAAA